MRVGQSIRCRHASDSAFTMNERGHEQPSGPPPGEQRHFLRPGGRGRADPARSDPGRFTQTTTDTVDVPTGCSIFRRRCPARPAAGPPSDTPTSSAGENHHAAATSPHGNNQNCSRRNYARSSAKYVDSGLNVDATGGAPPGRTPRLRSTLDQSAVGALRGARPAVGPWPRAVRRLCAVTRPRPGRVRWSGWE